jgi:acetyl esterase/lipase
MPRSFAERTRSNDGSDNDVSRDRHACGSFLTVRRTCLFVSSLLALSLAFAGGGSSRPAFSKHDVTIKADDGVSLAATLFEPSGNAPAGGWPAVVLMHGLGGDRSATATSSSPSTRAGTASRED